VKEIINPDRPNRFGIIMILVLLGVTAAYVGIRLLVWSNSPQLEDHLSIVYLNQAKTISSGDIDGIVKMTPDSTPAYPMLVAGASNFFDNPEQGARWISFGFSLLLFISILSIGRQYSSNAAVAVGLLLLAFNPEVVRISFSVLTEPVYMGLVYFGIWQFLKNVESPNWKNAAWLGLIFSAAYLCRWEGILFLAAVPAIQGLHFLFASSRKYSLKTYVQWSFSFATAFVALSLPHVWRISNIMGQFSVNGREVWGALDSLPIEGSLRQKVYKLDFDPGIINLFYLRFHPEALNSSVVEADFVSLLVQSLKLAVGNFIVFYNSLLGELVGSAVLMFFGIGILALLAKGKGFYLTTLFLFLGVFLSVPLLDKVSMRQIIIVAPLIILVAGIGVVSFSSYLAEALPVRARVFQHFFVFALALGMVGVNTVPLRSMYLNPDQVNGEYRADDYDQLIASIEAQPDFSKGVTKVIARKKYLAHFVGAKILPIPFSDYQSLVKYIQLNLADYLLIEESHLKGYPFLDNFSSDKSLPEFELIESSVDYKGNPQRLYKVTSSKSQG
jgi:hypothetical protein